MDKTTDLEILQYALENGIISMPDVREHMNRQRREQVNKIHRNNVYQGNDGRWVTYVGAGKGRRKLIKPVRDALYEALEEIYNIEIVKEEKHLPTFKECYDRWFEIKQMEFTSNNSIIKYQSEYKRFFKGTAFEKMPVADINEEVIKKFVYTAVKEHSLPKKSCRDLCGYIRNTLKSARVNRLIDENPFEFIEVKTFYPKCFQKPKTAEERTVSDNELKMLYACFDEDYKKNPSYIVPYAVELCTLMGLRVGEVSALEWSDVKDGFITICKSEKHDRLTNEKFVVQSTKNRKDRIFPITDEIADLLKRVRTAEENFNYVGQYIFSDETGRVVSSKVSDYVRCKCRMLGIPNKSIHAFRRTVSSRLKCNGVSSTIVSALLGHSEDVNENYYTYDVSDMKLKQGYVQSVTSAIKKAV